MRIAILMKQSFNGKELTFDSENHRRIMSKEERELNYDDGNALEAVMRCKESANKPEDIETIAITMGDIHCEDIIRQAFAVGCDSGVRVMDQALEGADTKITSEILADVIRRLGKIDVIFAGEKSQDGKTGSVGLMVAEYLNIPHISSVEEFTLSDTIAEVSRSREDCVEKVQVALPCLLTLSKRRNELRPMSLMGIGRAMDMEIEIWNLEKIYGNNFNKKLILGTQVLSIFEQKNKRKKRIIQPKFQGEKPDDESLVALRQMLKEIKVEKEKIL